MSSTETRRTISSVSTDSNWTLSSSVTSVVSCSRLTSSCNPLSSENCSDSAPSFTSSIGVSSSVFIDWSIIGTAMRAGLATSSCSSSSFSVSTSSRNIEDSSEIPDSVGAGIALRLTCKVLFSSFEDSLSESAESEDSESASVSPRSLCSMFTSTSCPSCFSSPRACKKCSMSGTNSLKSESSKHPLIRCAPS